MASTIDMMAMFKDFTGAMSFDTKAFETTLKNRNSFSEKFAGMAARKNADISTNWTNDTLTKITEIAQVKTDPSYYLKSISGFASTQAEVAAESIATFAEIAKKARMGSVEIMLEARKSLGD